MIIVRWCWIIIIIMITVVIISIIVILNVIGLNWVIIIGIWGIIFHYFCIRLHYYYIITLMH